MLEHEDEILTVTEKIHILFESYDPMPLAGHCYRQNKEAGWWTDLETGEPLNRNRDEQMMLILSEFSEAMEGHRKNLQDDHLPQFTMKEVELADALIRIGDYVAEHGLVLNPSSIRTFYNHPLVVIKQDDFAGNLYRILQHSLRYGSMELTFESLIAGIILLLDTFSHSFPGALAQKLIYNKNRADHKIENRKKEHGKKI